MESLASRGIAVIGLVATVEEAVVRAASDRPDVIVADIDVAGDLALDLALDLPAALPADGPAVLWWSGHDERYRVPAAQAGGSGYVSKRAGLDELVSAIRRVAVGQTTWLQADLRALRNAPKPPTARERQVLAGVLRRCRPRGTAGLPPGPRRVHLAEDGQRDGAVLGVRHVRPCHVIYVGHVLPCAEVVALLAAQVVARGERIRHQGE